jgi:tRNA-dihydrouridine synthase
VAIHARTRDEMSSVPACWDAVQRAVELARSLYSDPLQRPLIIGNGDVTSLEQLHRIAAETGCDGVMVGRALFGDPWFFNPEVDRGDLPHSEILGVLAEHIEHYQRLFQGIKPLEVMKKHFKAYVNGFRGSTALRARMMEARDYDEILGLIREAVPARRSA